MSDFDGLTVLISGPLGELAKFQQLLQGLDGTLCLQAAEGSDDGKVGVIRWAGRSARPRPFSVRGPRSGRKVQR
jgi:hypothetical protein